MLVNSSFPAIKPLPGIKKNFPEVTGRVDSQPMIYRKSNKNSSVDEVGMDRMFPSVGKTQLPKPRTHHDSSSISACLKTDTRKSGNPKKLEFKSNIPVRKPETIGNQIESPTKPKWNSTTQVNRSAEIKPLPGIKKSLGDFVRKPFRATPAPFSTHNPRLVVITKDRQEVKKDLPQQSVQKPGNKIIPGSWKPSPFRTQPPLNHLSGQSLSRFQQWQDVQRWRPHIMLAKCYNFYHFHQVLGNQHTNLHRPTKN